ncbi:MAG: hypothetical protein ABIJ28_01955, partial [Patescibacteria group bacterium]
APAFPPAELRRAKQNNFLFIFLIFRETLFLLKGFENCFALMFGLMPKRRKRFPTIRAFGARQAGKNSFPPTPFLFARLLETPSDFFGRRRGLVKNKRVVGGFRNLMSLCF